MDVRLSTAASAEVLKGFDDIVIATGDYSFIAQKGCSHVALHIKLSVGRRKS